MKRARIWHNEQPVWGRVEGDQIILDTGEALQANGEMDAAIQGFERAIALAPGQPDFHLSHGLALEAARRPREATVAYRNFLDLAPESPDADKVKAKIAMLETAR